MYVRQLLQALFLSMVLPTAALAVSDAPDVKPPVHNIQFNNEQGIYIAGSVTRYKAVNTTAKHNQTHATPFNIEAGLKLTDYIATEIGYFYLPTQALSNTNGLQQTGYNALAFAIKGMFPLSNTGLKLFAKIGPALNFTTHYNLTPGNTTTSIQSNQQEGLLYGVGVNYSLNDTLAMSIQYLSTVQNNNSSDTTNKPTNSLNYISHNYGVFSLNYLLQ